MNDETLDQRDGPEMTAEDVVAFLELMEAHGVEVVVDGGWGVDALLGEQTRRHRDLDIAVEHKDVPTIRALLEARGYRDVPVDDTWECNFVLGNDEGRLIDIHSFTFDAEGNNIFGVAYEYPSLQGTGTILGRRVRCVPPDWMVEFHTGYPLDEDDYHDVKLLCERFGIEVPDAYEEFESSA